MNTLDALYAILALVAAPVWARKARGGWSERFGNIAPLPVKSRPRIVLHAVSVGEVNALRTLVPLLAPSLEVVVSASTDTGMARAHELFGRAATVLRYPLDFSRCVRRFLDIVAPDAVGLVELELWPNFVSECRHRDIPVAVINGRLSERSFKGYRTVRPFIRRSFAALEFAAVQDSAYAARFEHMGVPPGRCLITGSMKWDAISTADGVAGADRLAALLGIDRGRPLIVAGSTGPGEEALFHAACPTGVQLLCAPRKPERFDEAAAALPGCVRRSRVTTPGERSTARVDRFLLDSIGELRQAYALADVVVVGRSFGTLFGSDPVEPVALGRATLIGPKYGDFQQAVEALTAAGGLKVTSREALASDLSGLLNDARARADMADRGRLSIQQHQGASRRHADLLTSLVARASPGPDPEQTRTEGAALGLSPPPLIG